MNATRKTKPALTPGNTALRLLIAAAIVAALSALSIFKPIDNTLFSLQAMIAQKPAPNDIAFVGLRENPSDPRNVAARTELAKTLSAAVRAGAEAIYVNVPLSQAKFSAADRALISTIRKNASIITFIDRYYDDYEGRARKDTSAKAIIGTADTVPNERYHDFMGYSWKAPRVLHVDGRRMASAASVIAGVEPQEDETFYIDYRLELGSVPAWDALGENDLGDDLSLPDLYGKTIVIGPVGEVERTPGHANVPTSLITILAAHTLRLGEPIFVPGWAIVLTISAVLLVMAKLQRGKGLGRTLLVLSSIVCITILASAQFGVILQLGGAMVYFLIAGAIAALNAYRISARKFDPRFNLPTFEALEEDLADFPPESAVVIAKVQNFDSVLSTVGQTEQYEYVKRLADRFKVIDPKLAIYTAGSYFAWIARPMAREDLESHLLGLRALLSEPIKVDGTPIDIGVTFGIDMTAEVNPSAKIAQARAAANATSPADLPVVFAEANNSPNRIWSLSLQHKVDTALAEGRIFPVYQPQFSGGKGSIYGVEALVRWIDEERGVISPGEFISQCEKAGRMEAITETVLRRSMREMCDANADGLHLSVNISATLLHDHRLVKMVRDTLDETGFPPSRLTLEVTESWRIIDERMARAVMGEIAALGVHWSIDDFGVQSATLETLLKYPFNEIKIDRLFTQAMCTSPKALAMVRMLCAFGRELEIDVVAEGAEDRATLRELENARCPRVQGFILARPMAMEELINQFFDKRAIEGRRVARNPESAG